MKQQLCCLHFHFLCAPLHPRPALGFMKCVGVSSSISDHLLIRPPLLKQTNNKASCQKQILCVCFNISSCDRRFGTKCNWLGGTFIYDTEKAYGFVDNDQRLALGT